MGTVLPCCRAMALVQHGPVGLNLLPRETLYARRGRFPLGDLTGPENKTQPPFGGAIERLH